MITTLRKYCKDLYVKTSSIYKSSACFVKSLSKYLTCKENVQKTQHKALSQIREKLDEEYLPYAEF